MDLKDGMNVKDRTGWMDGIDVKDWVGWMMDMKNGMG